VTAFALLACAQVAQAGVQAAGAVLSQDTVAVGEAFELRVHVEVPAGAVAHFPDTLPATDAIESLAPVTWRSEPTAGGGSRLALVYPLIAFRAGAVAVPGLDVPIAGAGGEVAVVRFSRRPVQVAPTFTPEQLRSGVRPEAADDVLGPNWNRPRLFLALLLSAALVGVVVSAVGRAGRPGRRHGPGTAAPATLEQARLVALAELDRLLAEETRPASVRELYVRSSAAVRRYVEGFDPGWGPALTATELLGRLEARIFGLDGRGAGPAGGRSLDPLRRELLIAEIVKFGRARPHVAEAEAHLRALRAWVEASGGSP
jgi:hypothetical protein